jgi:D-threo-aldose 1-dehydrogenase
MSAPLPRRRVGRTSLEVTTLGYGAAPIGGFRVSIPERDAIAMVETAHDRGVNHFDTSPYYGYGRSELRVGAALRDRPRDGYVLSTKVGRWLRPLRDGEEPPPGWGSGGRTGGLRFAATFDYSYDGVMRSIEQSQLRLGIPRIDILYVHDLDYWTTRDRALLDQRIRQLIDEGGHRALDELRRAGAIGAIGCGLNESDTSLRLARLADFDCILLAGRYTLLEQGALGEFLPYVAARGMSVVIGGPFNSGILAGEVKPGAKYDYADAPAAIVEKARRIEAVCRRHGVPLAAAALQFPLAHPAVCSVIPGAVSTAELEQNLASMRREIPAALWQELRAEGLLDPAAPVPGG